MTEYNYHTVIFTLTEYNIFSKKHDNYENLLYHCYNFIVPQTPTGFSVTGQNDRLHYNTTITFEWDPPQGSGPEAIVDYYLIVVTLRPLSHPVSNKVYSIPWSVTLEYNIEHTAVITAVNCAGESSPFILTNIEFSMLLYR